MNSPGPSDKVQMEKRKQDRRSSGEIIVDRRDLPRWPIEVDVECNFAGAIVAGVTLNLTVDGMYVQTETPVPADTEVEVRLGLEGLPPKTHARGRVVRQHKRKQDVSGFAVEFDQVEPAAQACIEDLALRGRTATA